MKKIKIKDLDLRLAVLDRMMRAGGLALQYSRRQAFQIKNLVRGCRGGRQKIKQQQEELRAQWERVFGRRES